MLSELVRPLRPWSDKNLSFTVKALYFQSSGQTNNCQIEVLFKWSDQSCTPFATSAIVDPFTLIIVSKWSTPLGIPKLFIHWLQVSMWKESQVDSFYCQFHLLTCTQITNKRNKMKLRWFKVVNFGSFQSQLSSNTQFCRLKGCGGKGWPPHQ